MFMLCFVISMCHIDKSERRDEANLIKNPLCKFFKNLIALTIFKSCLTNPPKKYSQTRFI